MFRLLAVPVMLCTFLHAETVRIQPKFVKGETFNIEIRKSRQDWIGGTTITPVRVETLEAGDAGVALDWVPGDTRFGDPAQEKNPLVAAVAQATAGVHFELKLNAKGEYGGVRNDKQVALLLAGVRESLLEKFLPLVAEQHRGQLHAYFGQALSPASLTSAATREARYLFAMNGIEIEQGKPIQEEGEMPGPFGAGTVPSKRSIRVRSTSPVAGEALIALRQDFDVSALPDVLTGLVGIAGEPKAPLKLEMFDEAEYVIDSRKNRVKAVNHVRTVIAGEGLKRVEVTGIRVTP
jgi:hypothetical protein